MWYCQLLQRLFCLFSLSSTHFWFIRIYLQRDAIVEVFYERHLDQLISVITSSCLPNDATRVGLESKNSNGIQASVKPEILLNICDLLCFCVLHHPYRIKYSSNLSILTGCLDGHFENGYLIINNQNQMINCINTGCRRFMDVLLLFEGVIIR